MRPLRRKRSGQVTRDPITGQERVLEMTEEQHIFTDQRSIDSEDLHYIYFLDCGCGDGPAAGRCYQCGAISCQNCHGRCQSCQKPICLACSCFQDVDAEHRLRLCGRCHEALNRKRLWSRIGKTIFSLFVEEVRHAE